MHETAIASKIIEEANQQGEVEELTLEIGELAHVPAHELVECLEQLVSWKITHSVRPSLVKCVNCSFEGPPKILERGHDSFIIECPKCTIPMPEVVDGKDIKIVNVKVK